MWASSTSPGHASPTGRLHALNRHGVDPLLIQTGVASNLRRFTCRQVARLDSLRGQDHTEFQTALGESNVANESETGEAKPTRKEDL